MNFEQMRQALHGYVHRDDQATVDNEPTALALSEAAIARRFFPRESYAALALTLVDGAAPLPADFGTLEAIVGGMGAEMEYRSLRQYQAEAAGPEHLRPGNTYTLTSSEVLAAQAHGTLLGSYFTRPAPGYTEADLTGASWLSTFHPDVWLHAALAEQWRFLQDFEAAELTDAYWQRLADRAMADTRASMQSGGAVRMKGR